MIGRQNGHIQLFWPSFTQQYTKRTYFLPDLCGLLQKDEIDCTLTVINYKRSPLLKLRALQLPILEPNFAKSGPVDCHLTF